MGAPFSIKEGGAPPNAVFNVTCLGIGGDGIAPFGLGLVPSTSPLGLARNRLLSYLAPNVVFRSVSTEMGRQFAEVGAGRRKFTGVLLSGYP
jgi:hypothetical protein